MPLTRVLGLALTVLGLVFALVAGLILAIGVNSEQLTLETALPAALAASVPILACVLGGTYLFGRIPKETEPNHYMREQRSLLDTLKRDGRVSLSSAAEELNVTSSEMRDIVHQLITLRILTGYVNWKRDVLCLIDWAEVASSGRCVECDAVLDVNQEHLLCGTCGSEYFSLV